MTGISEADWEQATLEALPVELDRLFICELNRQWP